MAKSQTNLKKLYIKQETLAYALKDIYKLSSKIDK
jgi:hypothetical protein